jgi:D-alanyl-lipoteichoic acid acyltransferase DltB (MBOAT superfamily)
MLFNSIDFAVFLPIVFILYWYVTSKNLRVQNILIVASSYLFYGWWDWRFLSLIVFSTIVDYAVGLRLSKTQSEVKRKALLWISILVNLGFLGVFKYYNFFLENFVTGFSFLGIEISANSLNIVLPVGISFYTFQTLSYTIDVYRKKLQPTTDLLAFSAFVSFFPQLVAGPIERATHLLPQFYKKRHFDYNKAVDGMRQILWGLFKKVVIADSAAEMANEIFNNSVDYSGSTLLMGAIFFTFQIYGDFSGYSDIAIGTSRLFGFDLKRNFAFPYFSRDIAEFWRRWHISLSTWFRDYLYIPLGGSRGGNWSRVRNTLIIFIVSGFWHGSKWTFLVWGLLNALFILPLIIFNKNRVHTDIVAQGKHMPTISELLKMTLTFGLTVFAWIFFRAKDIGHAWEYVTTLFSRSLFTVPDFKGDFRHVVITGVLIFVLILIEWFGREQQFALSRMGHGWKRPLRLGFYFIIAFSVLLFSGQKQEFIYFQF